MTKLIGSLVVSGTMVLLPALARPQYDDAIAAEPDAGMAAETVPPSAPAPSEVPPAPPSESPPAPPAQGYQGYAASAAPAGQWVYTQQYGWIWMPYADSFTYSPPGGYGEPYAYVYYPAYGWTWLATPWVWGIGPWPFFGVYGPARFAWYVHGWWRFPSRFHYAPAFRSGFGVHGPVFRGGPGFRAGPRPAPFRGGSAFIRGGRAPGFVAHVPAGRGGFGSGGFRASGWGNRGGGGSFGHGGSGGHGGGHGGGHAGGHGGRGRG